MLNITTVQSVALMLTLGLTLHAAPTNPSEKFTPAQLINAMHAVFGIHHARATHAKGIILEGTFKPDAEAATLTTAPHLQKQTSKITVRFSDTTGQSDIADNNAAASPRGMAIKFYLPNNSTTDLVAHSFNGFPAANSDEFRAFLLSIAASSPGAPAPTLLEKFLETHPAAKAFATMQKIPASFATIAYFGVNSFKFTNKAGESSYVRYQLIPDEDEALLSLAEAAGKSHNYLFDDIKVRLSQHPISFTLVAQIAETDDKIENPSIAWPGSRKKVTLGKLTITRLASNSPKEDKALFFIPNNIPQGIATADPMLDFRSKTYPISVKERQ